MTYSAFMLIKLFIKVKLTSVGFEHAQIFITAYNCSDLNSNIMQVFVR